MTTAPTWGPGETPPVTTSPSWWKRLFQAIHWTMMIPVLVVLASIFIPAMGFGARMNLGGLIGWLLQLRRKPTHRANVVISTSVPRDRVVALGAPDAKGYTQVESPPLEVAINPFRDKSVVKTMTGEVVQLPQGVHDHDVEEVILLQPGVTAVRVSEVSPVTKKVPMSRTTDELIAALEKLQAEKAP